MLKTVLMISVLTTSALLLFGCSHWGHRGGHGPGHYFSTSDTRPNAYVKGFRH